MHARLSYLKEDDQEEEGDACEYTNYNRYTADHAIDTLTDSVSYPQRFSVC